MVRQNARTPGLDQRIALSGATANRIVLHEDDPGVGAGVAQPSFVGELLSGLLAVDRCHLVDNEPTGAERLGEMSAPEAAIDENSGGGSRRDTDHVFDFLRRDVEVERDVGECVAGDEPIDEVLDACAAVDHEREAECDLWIDNHVGAVVRRQADSGGPAVSPVGDPLE